MNSTFETVSRSKGIYISEEIEYFAQFVEVWNNVTRMKKCVACILLLAALLLGSCSGPLFPGSQSPVETAADLTAADLSSADAEAYVHREQNLLFRDGEEVTLRAVNFDNLTWYSDPAAGGELFCTLHHDESDFEAVSELGFNAIRFFLKWDDLYTDASCSVRKAAGWDWLQQNIEWAKDNDIYLILDFHCPYGGFGSTNQGVWDIWTEEDARNAFLRAWTDIARFCAAETIVAGYDLMNEPSLPEDGENLYRDLLTDAIEAIRVEDPYHLVIVEAAVGIDGIAESWLRPNWVTVEEDNLMYSFHFYEPLGFTHVSPEGTAVMNYPSDSFDREDMVAAIEDCIGEDFLMDYPIFLGEFGCLDWTPGSGSEEWIRDVYEICAEEGIHTALFAYRSFEVFEDKDDYSFAISRMYTGAPTDDGVEEESNMVLEELLQSIFAGS